MNHNKLTGSSTRSNNILCFNSTVCPGFYQHRYFGFPLNVRDTPCDRSCKVTMKISEGAAPALTYTTLKYEREQHLH